jgi:ABC-type sugar transport system, ATPase component
MNKNILLQCKNVSKTYPGVKACDDVSLEILEGEIHAIVGENGAGKSTLIKIFAGVIKPDAGSKLLFKGEDANINNALDSVKRGIAVIYQDFSLFPNLTVAENISFSIELEEDHKFINWSKINRQARDILGELGVKGINPSSELDNLSLAEQQLVAIARALILNAKLIIMDEPTSALAIGEIENLFKIIKNLKDRGISILFISHKLEEVFKIAERITVLRDGKHIGTYLSKELNNEKLISLMVGRKIDFIKETSYCKEEILLEVNSLSKKGNYKNISFRLHKGEILGITGLVGSGRTEMVKTLFGINIPEKGKIFLNGKEVKISSPEVAMKLGFSYIPEDRQLEGLVIESPVKNNITITILKNLLNHFGLLNLNKENSLVDEYIKILDIRPPDQNMLAKNLSGGNQQKVVIAKWLITNPSVLIVDEPTNGIDVGAKIEIHKLLQKLAKEGMGIIMVSSELLEVLTMSDRILIMNRGEIVTEFDKDEATQEKIMNKALMI